MQKNYYLINVPKVVDEIFEDEIIVINFENGDYFSLRQSAIDIWKDIKNGYSFKLILENLQIRYKTNVSEAQGILSKLIDEFIKEGLIHPSTETKEDNNPTAEIPITQVPFETPIFEKFTDMNDLLLLDPVHDVDEKGWPHANPNEKNG